MVAKRLNEALLNDKLAAAPVANDSHPGIRRDDEARCSRYGDTLTPDSLHFCRDISQHFATQ